MSMVAGLWKGTMDGEWHCWCPACGSEEYVDVSDDDFEVLDDGNKEWLVYCSECGQGFYVSESYNE